MKPLCIDLFCGLGGWTEGFLAEGYDVVGFDIERHQYGTHEYPAQLVIQDVLTLRGSQFKDAAVIVASPPCQAYSYRAMPWKRAKALPPPDNSLFESCFRIAKEAGVPLVVENVKGAQPWVGRAAWHYGSFYLWGDIPALMPTTLRFKSTGQDWSRFSKTGEVSPHWNLAAAEVKNPANHDVDRQCADSFGWSKESPLRDCNSKSPRRKAASALIAKIPFELSNHIARCFKPRAL